MDGDAATPRAGLNQPECSYFATRIAALVASAQSIAHSGAEDDPRPMRALTKASNGKERLKQPIQLPKLLVLFHTHPVLSQQ